MPHLTGRTVATLLVVAILGAGSTNAMTPLAKPVANPGIAAGQAAPFAGSWSITLPTRQATEPDTDLAVCALPVRIEMANKTHIFYLGPDETEADAAIELIADGDGTSWRPIAGGPAFFAVWVTPDNFYLYDAVAEGEPDWAAPYIYTRCE